MPIKIPDEKKEEIRDRADLVEVVQDYVKLKRSGRSWKGLCPFHDEKTPSFHVTPDMGIYKCFGCGASGDVFNFMMEMEGVGFVEAMRELADRFNISLPKPDEQEFDETHHLREGIFHALKYAGVYFYRQLAENDEAEKARRYLKQRGYDRSAIKKYGLGYAPKDGDSFYRAAIDSGLNEEYLQEAGLIKPSNRSGDFYDAFRGRLMFPIFNTSGKVIAFAGRALRKADKAKYINSPQTKVYDKSNVLYGLNFAKNEIRSSDEAILVEGYTDVLSLHQAEVENAVASSGTSLTTGQLKLLRRYGSKLTMIYDSDNAGRMAMKRGLQLALQEGLEVKLLELEEGEDPDSFIRQFGKDAFLEVKKEKTEDYVSYLVHQAQNEGQWDDPSGKQQTITEVLECIALMPDKVAQETFLQHLGALTEINLRKIHEMFGPVMQKIKQEEKRSRKRRKHRLERERERRTNSKNDTPENRRQSTGSSIFSAPYELPKSRPGYEKELIRLMLQYGRKMIGYIGSHCSDTYFEDGQLKTFYLDIIQRYKHDEATTVEHYSSRNHPYPQLVGEIMMEEHEVSKSHGDKLGVQYKRDQNRYSTAKGALKAILLQYLNRKQNQLQKVYSRTAEGERKPIVEQINDIGRKRTRIQKLSLNEFLPDPEDEEGYTSEKVFNYKMRK